MVRSDGDKMRQTLILELPDDRVKSDLASILLEGNGEIELDDQWVTVPADVALEIVARSFASYEFEIGFGDCYRVVIAIGGVTSCAHGIAHAGICFAMLWYSSDVRLINVDFLSAMP